MKRIIMILCVIFFLGCATAQTKPVDPVATTEQTDKEKEIDTLSSILEATFYAITFMIH